MKKVFNTPPGWPEPPAGWSARPGWQPDPSWGPPPEGWKLWIPRNPHPFRTSLVVGLVAFAAGACVILSTGMDEPSVRLGAWTARYLIIAVVTGFIVGASNRRWRWWEYLLASFGGHLLLAMITLVNQLQV